MRTRLSICRRKAVYAAEAEAMVAVLAPLHRQELLILVAVAELEIMLIPLLAQTAALA